MQTHEEATVYVKELDTFLNLKVLEDSPAVLSLGKLCNEHGCSLRVDQRSKTTSYFGYSATRKTSYRSWFLVYLQLPQACLIIPRLPQVRLPMTSSTVKRKLDKNRETRAIPMVARIQTLNQQKGLGVDHLTHDTWVVYFRTWRRRSLFFGRAPTCRNQSNVWSSQRLLHVIQKNRDQNPSLGKICPSEPPRS